MKNLLYFILLASSFYSTGCSLYSKSAAPTEDQSSQNWISQSNRLATEYVLAISANHPEFGSTLGLTEFDARGVLLDSETEKKDRAMYQLWLDKLNQLASNSAKKPNRELLTDIQVLQTWLKNQLSMQDILLASHEVEFEHGIVFIFSNLKNLLNHQSTPERKRDAIERLRVYVNGDARHRPILEAMQEIFRDKLAKYKGQRMLLPFKGEVEQYLKDSSSILLGVEDLLKTSGRTDWLSDFERLTAQAKAYDVFTKKEVLPLARNNFQVPPAVYTQLLLQRGIDVSPKELIAIGLADYKELYQRLVFQSKEMAKKYKLANSNPANVIRFLKAQHPPKNMNLEELYHESDRKLTEIIIKNSLVSLPEVPLKIRIANEAESRIVPVPNLSVPPLINNQGERPEFIVPSSAGKPSLDDFLSPYAATVLTAHEGRPGHDLQFGKMLDQGQSIIRSRFAHNSVNVEGWALYAEDLVYPYLEPEEQIFGTLFRLWRIARMFLDPQLQLGQVQDQRAIEIYTKELGISDALAKLELRRYKFEASGQAPSYYFGYLIVKKMHEVAKERLGANFAEKCFNDKLLSYGLLPLRRSAERIATELICSK